MTSHEKIALPRQAAHVWHATLDGASKHLIRLEPMLSVDERERAARLRRSEDRNRFVVTRGFLREVLSTYTHIDPAVIQFEYGPKGKPRMQAGSAVAPLQFNLSHCDSIALLAITADRPVGVDIERVRADPEDSLIVRQFFSPAEREEYFSVGDADKPRAFARLWTRKEAYLKALGEGLSKPLDSFTVGFTSRAYTHHALPLQTRGDTEPWTVLGLDVACGYEAALAAPGEILDVLSWIWQPGLRVGSSLTSSCAPYRDRPLSGGRRDQHADKRIDSASR